MSESTHPAFNDAELEASLRGLGVTEVEQRLEFSALLAGTTGGGAEDPSVSVCCTCKIPPDDIFGDGKPEIASQSDPTPGDTYWGTGPTSGMGR